MLTLGRDGESVSMSVSKNGKARGHVIIWRTGTETHLVVDAANIVVAKERNRLVEALPNEPALREEASILLGDLAIEMMNASEAAPSQPKGPTDPFVEPARWEHPVSGTELLDELCRIIRHYVVLPSHADTAISLWVMHTYVTDVTDYTPYLLVSSPVRECGKTTLLELLLHLAHRAQMTGGITAAALYRRIDKHSPAMLLDELDARLRGDGGEALRGVLNTGFQRSGKVTICVGDDHEDRDFSTFCPKVLSGIALARMWDTVTSRSIPLRLARASREQLQGIEKVRGDRIAAAMLPIRRRLYRWADDNRAALRVTDAVTPDVLGARQSDVWRPLLAIADVAGGHWPETARTAAVAIHGVSEDEGDYGLLMLQDVHDLFAARPVDDVMFSAAIVQELCKREDRPWPEYRHDKPLTTRGLASLLGRFGVKPQTVRVGDDTAKGYRLTDLAPAFKTYLTHTPRTPSGENVTSVTPPLVTDVTARTDGVGPIADDPIKQENTFAESRAIRDAARARKGSYEADERAGLMAGL